MDVDMLKGSLIRDNTGTHGSVADFLRRQGLVGEQSHLSIVSAYFTAYAYDAMREQLDKAAKVRFLFGEPTFVRSDARLPRRAFRLTSDRLDLARKLSQKRVARDCAQWIASDRVEVKSMRDNRLLHGKLYFVKDEGNAKDRGNAIFGSSNFTCHGLGLVPDTNNLELNMVVDSDQQRDSLLHWFDALWNDPVRVEDVKASVLEALSTVYAESAPEEVYLKTLYHLFGSRLGADQISDDQITAPLKETRIWQTLYDFQRDGVKGALRKMEAFNGCILADGVGLGKTYEALAIIKHYERKKLPVLLLCPKKLAGNWSRYLHVDTNNELGEAFHFDLFFQTDMGRPGTAWNGRNLAEIRWDQYGLVVIDESHNFRNTGTLDVSGSGRMSRYRFLMERVLKANGQTKVLLLSATPVNNSLSDLRNQIALITADNTAAFAEPLQIPNFATTVDRAQAQFIAWSRDPARSVATLHGRFGSDFLRLLDALTIARSRKHILSLYAADKAGGAWGFPERLKPVSLYPPIDVKDEFLSFAKIVREIEGLTLAVYNPTRFLKPECTGLYQKTAVKGFTQSDREVSLIGMMKGNLLKRLESSVEAFELTLHTMRTRMEKARNKIKAYQANPGSGSDLELDCAMDDPDQVFEGKFLIKLSHLKLDDYLKALKADEDQLHGMYSSARNVTPERDAKLAELCDLVLKKATEPTSDRKGIANRKVLVFTAFADTATYLYENLADVYRSRTGGHIALVTGSDLSRATLGRNRFDHILANFSPRSQNREKRMAETNGNAGFATESEGEIDLLIATDCISEGQNLQDCDWCVNYDVHWNPVRLVQRFGRIDRLESRNDLVQMITFWPTPDLDQYLKLKGRVEAKMHLVDATATGSDNPLNEGDQEALLSADEHFRLRQMRKLQSEGLDLDSEEDRGFTLTSFSLSACANDLFSHLDKDRQHLADLPLGLHAVVASGEAATPGAIFCLRQKNATDAQIKLNLLAPYFLVYASDNGGVVQPFTQSHKTLELFKALCLGKVEADMALCKLYNELTCQGADMSHAKALLDAALASIKAGLGAQAAKGLQSDAAFVLPALAETAVAADQFELITWLVIATPFTH
jgi:hypothetical protein